MERWKKISYMVSVYVFLTEVRPLEPFFTAYLTGPDGNLSLSEVANTLESIKLYSALLGTIAMLCCADYLLYKPNIIFLTSWSCVSYLLIVNSPSLFQLKLSMVGLGVMYSSSALAPSYLYAQIADPKHFQMATGIVWCALQLGKFVGDIVAQLIVNGTGGIYTILPYCNVFTYTLALICAINFPPIKRTIQFPDTNVPNENCPLLKYDKNKKNIKNGIRQKYDYNIDKVKTAFKELLIKFKTEYSKPILQKNCFWHIIDVVSYIQILTNINLLYSYVVEKPGNNDVLSNGFAEAVATLCGAAGCYFMGNVHLEQIHYSDMFTAICTLLMGGLMISCYFYDHLFNVYLSYIIYGILFQCHFIIKYTEIVKQLDIHCYSIVLEFNYCVSLILISIMTLFFVQFNFMDISIPGRFLFFGGIYSSLGIVFLFISLYNKD